MPYTVAVLIGSLRKESLTRQFVEALKGISPEGLKLEVVEIGALPLFNADFEANPPAEVTAFKQAIEKSDAVLFATPEYNRSVPGVLKNAIDWGSRPYGKSSWNGKPAAVVSISQGVLSGFGANHHLRQSLVFLNMPTLQQPEAYIAQVQTLLDGKGGFVKPETKGFMESFLKAFEGWIAKVKG
ncbi:NADPH-dependent FMN reductase [Aestuariivirga sp.]|uniref:NADPH-dependent FMN reductase n=1 Tax=Aestuariivirga sp. TaxID=2650926 RepID=UPI0035AE4365